MDGNGLFTRISDMCREVLGYSPAEVEGRMHFYDLHPEDGRDDFRRKGLAVIAGREAFRNIGNPVVTRDGRLLWVVTNAVPILNPDGTLACYRGIDVDITERKLSEDALRVKNYVFDSSIAANSIADTDGTITEVNQAFLQMWGYPHRSTVAGRPVSQFIADPEKGAAIMETLNEQGRWQGDYTARRMDGSVFTAHGLASILYDRNGRHIGYQSSVIDVSESKMVEERLRDSEARHLALLNAMPDMMFLLDQNGVFVDHHSSGDSRLLLSPEAFMGRRITDVLPPEISGPTMASIEDIRRGMEARPFRYKAEQDGRTGYFESRIVACSGNLFMSIVRDITDLTLSEIEQQNLSAQLRQAHKMESVGRLAGGVAHDFNNMISVILGHAEMALGKIRPTDPVVADLKEIYQSAERSADLTRQLLAFARRQTVSPRVLDLNATLDGMRNMLGRLIGEDIDLQWSPGENLWPVRVDPSQMDHMLANLCINARQAMAGAGTIRIATYNKLIDQVFSATHPGAGAGDHVVLEIADNGQGMDRETLDHIFEPFFTTREPGQGTGLGLSTVYGIVKQSSGFIEVESEKGVGTTFRVYLPRSATPVESIPEVSEPRSFSGGGETILLVEDEKAILEMVTTMLEKLGYRVMATHSPEEALAMAKKHRDDISLLVTDVIMPGQNGRDLAWTLRAVLPGLKCLFMSGYTSDVIAHHGVLEKGVFFIAKPFTSRQLAASDIRALNENAAPAAETGKE